MSKIDNETVESLSILSRIHTTPEERERLKTDLQKILDFVDSLKEVDTEGVEPTYHVSKELVNVSRDDELNSPAAKDELLDRSTFLNLAPDQIAGMVRVPSFMGGKE